MRSLGHVSALEADVDVNDSIDRRVGLGHGVGNTDISASRAVGRKNFTLPAAN